MRTEFAIIFALGVVYGSQAAAPAYSCFDPPGEGQTNPLGEGFEDVVEEDCCEALIDESDIAEGRLVFWDPVNCYHGTGEYAIMEEVLCRAHDTDGCRFCRETCEEHEGACIACDEITTTGTAAPTMSPSDYPSVSPSAAPTPTPTTGTLAPFGIFPETPEPTMWLPTSTAAPTSTGGEECPCEANMSVVERQVLRRRSKTLRCDPTCSDGSDLTWGVINCNFFDLGQNCRACSDVCEEDEDGAWLDRFGIMCKPCSAIP